MSPRQRKPPGALLRELLTKHKIGARTLARALSELPDGKAIDTERRNITRWLGSHNRPSSEEAERLVEAFRRLEVILPIDYFKPAREPTWQQQMEARWAKTVDALQARIDELERRIGG